MDIYEKSNTYLIVGFIFSFLFSAGFGYLAYLTYREAGHITESLGITAIVFFVIPIFAYLFALLFGFAALVAIAAGILAIVCLNKHTKPLYIICKIFGCISLNPFIIVGAKMGLANVRRKVA